MAYGYSFLKEGEELQTFSQWLQAISTQNVIFHQNLLIFSRVRIIQCIGLVVPQSSQKDNWQQITSNLGVNSRSQSGVYHLDIFRLPGLVSH